MKPRYISLALLLFIAAALVLVFSIGCTTAGKATKYFDSHMDTAAGYCASRYAVKADSITIVRIDSAGYKQFIDSSMKYTDSVLLAAQARYNSNKAMLLAQVKELQEKGEYSESVAQELANQINNMRAPDTAGLRASIEIQIRSTLKPCADSITRVKQEDMAALAAETARANNYQRLAVEYETGMKSPAIVFGWLFQVLFGKWYFWAILAAFGLFFTRKLWVKMLI